MPISYYQCSTSGIKNKLITKARPYNIPTIGKLDFIYFRILISIILVIEYLHTAERE